MIKRKVIAQDLRIAAAGANKHVVLITPGWVRKIELSIGTTPAFGAGSYVANTALKSIIVRYCTVEIMNLTGINNVDDKISAGMELLRAVEAQRAGVAQSDNIWTIRFLEPILSSPATPLEIEFLFTTDERMGGDSGQACSAGDIDVEVEFDETPGRKNPTIPLWTSWNVLDGANTGDRYHYLPPSPVKGKKLRLVLFRTADSNAVSATIYATLNIILNGVIKWTGKMSKMTNEGQQKSGLALGTGVFLWSPGKNGMIVEPQTLLFRFNIASASTIAELEFIFLWY